MKVLYKINKIKYILFFFLLFTPFLVSAQKIEYIPLVTLPGVSEQKRPVDMDKFLPGMFNLLIGIAAALAFLMLVWEGFIYVFEDSISEKAKIKEKLKQTIYGLGFVLISYAIVYEINPGSLSLKLEIQKPSVDLARAVVYQGFGSSDVFLDGDEEKTRNVLEGAGIKINNNGKTCAPGEKSGCTNVGGLSTDAVYGVIELQKECGTGCYIQITGGTEDGHTTHGVGRSQVDLNPSSSLNAYLKTIKPSLDTNKLKNKDTVIVKLNGRNVTFTYEEIGANGRASGNHWHVSF
jgi:hypothetical protein